MYQHKPEATLKEILVNSLGVKAVVDKTRRIYFIENVKFHFDKVSSLGTFIQVEAIDKDGQSEGKCYRNNVTGMLHYIKIADEDFIAISYTDMVMHHQENATL